MVSALFWIWDSYGMSYQRAVQWGVTVHYAALEPNYEPGAQGFMDIKRRFSSLAISITYTDSTAETTEVLTVPQWLFVQ